MSYVQSIGLITVDVDLDCLAEINRFLHSKVKLFAPDHTVPLEGSHCVQPIHKEWGVSSTSLSGE